MRRALFAAVLAILIADASGITSILAPESCTISASETAPDGGCPAFCVRCACACCASPLVRELAAIIGGEFLPPVPVPAASHDTLPTGIPLDIFHVPKALLT